MCFVVQRQKNCFSDSCMCLWVDNKGLSSTPVFIKECYSLSTDADLNQQQDLKSLMGVP